MVIAPCPDCRRSEYKSYGSSRTLGADCTYYQYLQCKCSRKYRISRSRDFRHIEGWPRPRPGEPIIISGRPVNSDCFLITDNPKQSNRYRIPDIFLAEGSLATEIVQDRSFVGLSCLALDDRAPLLKGWGYAEMLPTLGYWPKGRLDPLRSGPRLAVGISLAAYYEAPAILVNIPGLKKSKLWRDYFLSLFDAHPEISLDFIDSDDLQKVYHEVKTLT